MTKPAFDCFLCTRPERDKGMHGWILWNEHGDTGPDYPNRKGGL